MKIRCLLFGIAGFLLCTIPITSAAQKKARIKFSADNIEFDEMLGKKARRLIGNVVFEHRGMVMNCDSAYQYTDRNSLDGFGRVHVKGGDSLDLYCRVLHYDGENQLFECEEEVVLDNGSIHLTTDRLTYDRTRNLGFYLQGGTINNREDQSVLTSQRAYYFTQSDEFYFKKDVVYSHPEFEIRADTLKYHSKPKLTIFLGPTDIHADSNLIHCERGYFDALSKKSKHYSNAYVISDKRIISGDTITYESNSHFGRIVGNANIIDTAENLSVRGQLALIYQKEDSAVVTIRSELQQYFDEDTLFLHADTFKVYTGADADTIARIIEAYRHIRFFKNDLQGKCDSMIYTFADSAIKMYFDPILWTGENQITGDYIQLNMKAGRIHTMDITKDAFVNSRVDSIRYNQIRGKDMKGFFRGNRLHLIDVTGNGQTVYWARDDELKYIGVNRGESSSLKIRLKDSEVSQVSYINDASATFFPLYELPEQELRLKGFSWRIKLRPLSRNDIFLWRE